MTSSVQKEYEYRGLMASTWDDLRGDPSGRHDRDFYLAVIRQAGEPVLEVGCGTGRLLLDFLAAGLDIEGLDVSPEMLAICGEKAQLRGLAPTLHCSPIETMALRRRYRTIIASSSVLQLIPDLDDVRRAVMRLHAHLLPGGVLVAPFMTLWLEGMPLQREWENAQVRTTDGALLQRTGRVWYDPRDGCEHTEDIYQVVVDGQVVAAEQHRRSPASRSYTQAQALHLYEQGGFSSTWSVRGFSQDAPAAGDDFFTLIGRKSLKLTRSEHTLDIAVGSHC